MLGKKFGRKFKGEKLDRLTEILMKMDAYLEAEEWEKLNELVKELDTEIDIRLKGGYLPEEELKKVQKMLAYFEEKAKRKKEELNKQRLELKKLKKYGEF